jgi:A118 family predicted phage portal protein
MLDIKSYISKYFEGRKIESQSEYLSLWEDWYRGYVKDFHKYRIYTGKQYVTVNRKTLRIAKKCCEDWANLLLNEKCSITIKDQPKLDDLLFANNFWVRGNSLIEKTFALSIGATVESLENLTITEKGDIVKTKDAKPKIDYITAKNIYPITYRNGELVECAFVKEDTNATNISIHKLNENGEYDVINLVVEAKNNIATISKEFTFHTKSKKPLYQIYKPNIANNMDIDSPLGISIFANAIDILKAIDTNYDAFDMEVQLGRRRVMVSSSLIDTDENGNFIGAFDPNDIVYYTIPSDAGGDEQLIQELASQLRTNDLSLSLQEQLNLFSASVGFGKNYYTFGAGGGGRPIQTATGIIAQNSDLFRSIKKHEIILEKALKDMVEMLVYLTNEFTLDHIEIGDEIVVNFDDSIIEDTESKKNSDRTDVTNGIMSKQEYRAKWYGEEMEKAKENLDSFGLNDLDTRINALLPALQSGAITVELYVDNVFKDAPNREEIIAYIKEQLSKTSEPININEIA